MRRLKRSFSQREIETSEIENEAMNNPKEDASSSIKETPVILDVSEKDRMLSDISHITLNSSSSSNSQFLYFHFNIFDRNKYCHCISVNYNNFQLLHYITLYNYYIIYILQISYYEAK